jgi:hypothetical protein
LASASGDGNFLLPSHGEARFGDLRAFQTLFSMFDPGVPGWSFPMTISVWNTGETRFGDLRAFQNLIFKVWQGRLGIVISYYHLNLELQRNPFW